MITVLISRSCMKVSKPKDYESKTFFVYHYSACQGRLLCKTDLIAVEL